MKIFNFKKKPKKLPYGRSCYPSKLPDGRDCTHIVYRDPPAPIVGGRKAVRKRLRDLKKKRDGYKRNAFSIGANEQIAIAKEISELTQWLDRR